MNTMKALVKRRSEPGLWLDEVPVPDIGIDEVLIRVERTGVCGTDLHIYNWDAWAQKTIPVPMVVGHEFVGVIEAVGSNVIDFKPGDVVVMNDLGEAVWERQTEAAAAGPPSPVRRRRCRTARRYPY